MIHSLTLQKDWRILRSSAANFFCALKAIPPPFPAPMTGSSTEWIVGVSIVACLFLAGLIIFCYCCQKDGSNAETNPLIDRGSGQGQPSTVPPVPTRRSGGAAAQCLLEGAALDNVNRWLDDVARCTKERTLINPNEPASGQMASVMPDDLDSAGLATGSAHLMPDMLESTGLHTPRGPNTPRVSDLGARDDD